MWPSLSVGAIGAIAIAPSDNDVVWVGTGEAAPRNDASYGDGVWLTRDGGVHWAHRGLGNTHAIAKILVDPNHPNVALVGALGNPFADYVYTTSTTAKLFWERTGRWTLNHGDASGWVLDRDDWDSLHLVGVSTPINPNMVAVQDTVYDDGRHEFTIGGVRYSFLAKGDAWL